MATPNAESREPSQPNDSEEKVYPYSRDQYVAAITEFYELLTKLYVPRSALKFPPPGGWPSITPENCAGFGKSDFVVDLLKHLPYISGGRYDIETEVHYKSNVVDYSAATPEHFASERIKLGEIPVASQQPVTADMIVLAEGYESGGRVILLDTAAGEAIEEMIRCDRADQDDVLTYFTKLTESYRTLRLLPVPGYHIIDDMGHVDDVPGDQLPEPIADSASEFPTDTDVQWLRHIYRSHGWPGAGFRKEEAHQAIEDYLNVIGFDGAR